jgi:hypothetical protein
MSFTLSTIRSAIKAQLEANLKGREQQIDTDGSGSGFPRITFELVRTPTYFGTFGADGVAFVEARFVIVTGASDRPSGIKVLDDYLSVGTGNGSSLVDAIQTDVSFGGTVQGLTMEPGDYDPDGMTAELLVTFIAMKQGAEV